MAIKKKNSKKLDIRQKQDMRFKEALKAMPEYNKEALCYFTESMLQRYKMDFVQTRRLKNADEFLEYLFKIRFFQPNRECLDFLILRRDERLGRFGMIHHLCDEPFLKKMIKSGYRNAEVRRAITKFVYLLKKNITKDDLREYFAYFDREHLRERRAIWGER